ncbi:MAG: polymer-forming cytoskeletal protein [Candidatus Pacearchaeota archaeon]
MAFGKFKNNSEPESRDSLESSGEKDTKSTLNVSSKAYLGKGSRVVGTLSFQGPAQLDGDIEGEIHASDSLVIGESAVIKAKVIGNDVTVRGQVSGDIIAKTRLALEKPAKITGNISCPLLRIEEGVNFEGNCNMSKTV